jgi:NifU-like protein involved in Fe-S cluster formation
MWDKEGVDYFPTSYNLGINKDNSIFRGLTKWEGVKTYQNRIHCSLGRERGLNPILTNHFS